MIKLVGHFQLAFVRSLYCECPHHTYDSHQLVHLRQINISMGITAIYSSSHLSVQDLLSIMSLKDGDVQYDPLEPEPEPDEQSKHFLHINVSRNLPELER